MSEEVAGERNAAILAVRQQSMTIFASTKPAPTGSSLDSGDGCVTEDNFCRFIGHIRGEVTKRFSLRRLRINFGRLTRVLEIEVQSFGLTGGK